jgi:hypothetical protein
MIVSCFHQLFRGKLMIINQTGIWNWQDSLLPRYLISSSSHVAPWWTGSVQIIGWRFMRSFSGRSKTNARRTSLLRLARRGKRSRMQESG